MFGRTRVSVPPPLRTQFDDVDKDDARRYVVAATPTALTTSPAETLVASDEDDLPSAVSKESSDLQGDERRDTIVGTQEVKVAMVTSVSMLDICARLREPDGNLPWMVDYPCKPAAEDSPKLPTDVPSGAQHNLAVSRATANHAGVRHYRPSTIRTDLQALRKDLSRIVRTRNMTMEERGLLADIFHHNQHLRSLTADVPKYGAVSARLKACEQQLSALRRRRRTFFDLPTELRQQIYRYATPTDCWRYDTMVRNASTTFPLLSVSRQVRMESKFLLYNLSTIHFDLRSTRNMDLFDRWLGSLAHDSHQVQHLRLDHHLLFDSPGSAFTTARACTTTFDLLADDLVGIKVVSFPDHSGSCTCTSHQMFQTWLQGEGAEDKPMFEGKDRLQPLSLDLSRENAAMVQVLSCWRSLFASLSYDEQVFGMDCRAEAACARQESGQAGPHAWRSRGMIGGVGIRISAV